MPLLLAAAVGSTLPGLLLRLTGTTLAPPVEAVVFGTTVFGSAFLLAWAAEIAQLEMSQALAVAILAVIAVLPEYAVDLYFAWRAAEQPAYAQYATANMTGANRLLVGLGWPVIVLLFAVKFRRGAVRLSPVHSAGISYLGIATAYCFLIPLKGSLSLLDTVVLLAIFGGYIRQIALLESEEPELVGPAAWLGGLPRRRRLAATAALFLFSGAVILLVAEPFAEALIRSGEALGVDEYLLVQWVAPIASEAPEFIIASTWALRGDPQAGLGALVSSKVNQWTLLIGTIPLVYSINLGAAGRLPLDIRQEGELWLTGAQSLLATALLLNLRLGLGEAALLLVLFAAQLLYPPIRIEVAVVYVAIAAVYLVGRRRHIPSILRQGLRRGGGR